MFTLFLGSTCDGVFEGFAAGVVSSTHSALVLLLRGADRSVTAHFLFMNDMESLTHVDLTRCSLSLSHTHMMSLTSHSPRTHTLCGSLYEQRVPSRTILCMKTTSRVSLDWQCRWQRLLAGKTKHKANTQKVTQLAHLRWWFHLYNRHGIVFLFSEWASPWVSVALCRLIVSVCVTHSTTTWASGDKTWQFIPARNEHSYFITFITHGHNPETSSSWRSDTNKQVADVLL